MDKLTPSRGAEHLSTAQPAFLEQLRPLERKMGLVLTLFKGASITFLGTTQLTPESSFHLGYTRTARGAAGRGGSGEKSRVEPPRVDAEAARCRDRKSVV